MVVQVPTDGKPVRGLIQDHVIGAVRLTKRDTFIGREEFTALVAVACVREGRSLTPSDFTRTTLHTHQEEPIAMPPPAILKPKPLWTGKQVRGWPRLRDT